MDKKRYVMRGGSWRDVPIGCRSASRLSDTRVNRYDDFGFRVVVEAIPKVSGYLKGGSFADPQKALASDRIAIQKGTVKHKEIGTRIVHGQGETRMTNKLNLVTIPSGELNGYKIESFEMSDTVITQKQWRAVANLPKVDIDLDPDPSHFKGLDRPVECINYFEAVEFCKRLSKATGLQYRLPTEVEWEYACRAGTTTDYNTGDEITTAQANFDDYGKSEKRNYRWHTVPVKTFPPNAWGLYEMHGNVWEWCEPSNSREVDLDNL